MEPVERRDPYVYESMLFQGLSQAPSHERGLVGGYGREEAPEVPLGIDLRIEHIRFRETHASARPEQVEDLPPRPIEVQVMQNGRADHRVERTLHAAVLE